MIIKQVFHHYENWEDYKNGMWRKESKENEPVYLEKAIVFTGDHKLYGSWMQKVVYQWPIACEHHLSDNSLNRKAWIGHAAVCLAFKCPEYITRLAWWKLSEEQQIKANKQAEKAIKKWEQQYRVKINSCFQATLFS